MGGFIPLLYNEAMKKKEAVSSVPANAQTILSSHSGKTMNWWERAKLGFKLGVGDSIGLDSTNNKIAEIEAWKSRQAQRGLESDLTNIANQKTAGQTALINEQLAKNIKQLNASAAGTGMYRSGQRLSDIGDAQVKATEAVSRVSSENLMQAKLASLGQGNWQKEYDLQLSKLEAAKNAGDSESVGQIAEGIASSGFLDKLLGLDKSTGTSANPEEIAGGVYPSPRNPEEILGNGAVTGSEGNANIFGNLFRKTPTGSTDLMGTPLSNTDYTQEPNYIDDLINSL